LMPNTTAHQTSDGKIIGLTTRSAVPEILQL
jgi:hypothetical protein